MSSINNIGICTHANYTLRQLYTCSNQLQPLHNAYTCLTDMILKFVSYASVPMRKRLGRRMRSWYLTQTGCYIISKFKILKQEDDHPPVHIEYTHAYLLILFKISAHHMISSQSAYLKVVR